MRKLLFILLLFALSGCSHLVFYPHKQHLLDPAKLGIEFQSHTFTSADGVRLHGWLLPAQTDEVKGNILFAHGNAENISTHLGSVWWLPQHGFNVFLFDYRGYGHSEGEPSLDGVILDFAAALGTFRQMDGVAEQGVFILGQSLGAVVSISALSRMEDNSGINGVIIEGGMTSLRKVAREMLARSWLTWPLQWPLSLTIDDSYRPVDDIAKLGGTPLLIIHSRSDEVIPYHHGEELHTAAAEPKEFWALDNTRHIAAFASEEHQQRLVAWLLRHNLY